MHEANISLVYGGGTKGIMGEIARTLVSLSGPQAVHGIIPRALIRTEEGYTGTAIAEVGRETPPTTTTNTSKTAEKVMSKDEIAAMDQQFTLSNAESGFNIISINESEYGTTTIVPDMHTRKRLMSSHVINGGPGSGFVALAGGYGTLEEVMEMVTWNQLGIHKCGIVLVNIDGYWDGLIEWVKRAVREQFVGVSQGTILAEVTRPEDVVEALRDYRLAEGRFNLEWTR